jgi:hypothetical protein
VDHHLDGCEEDVAEEREVAGRRGLGDEVLIGALAEGLSYSAAAQLANVSPRTVRRRMAEDRFATLVAQRRSQRVGEVTGVLAGLARRAVATLEDCLDAERPADRIRAAQVVLSELHRFRDQVDLEDRISRLENTAAGGRNVDGAERI